MSIAMSVKCDDCRNYLDDGEQVYCSKCYAQLSNEIDNLNDEIASLKKQLIEKEKES